MINIYLDKNTLYEIQLIKQNENIETIKKKMKVNKNEIYISSS